MYPTGSYNRFTCDVLNVYQDYTSDDIISFGILIADPRQQESKEYIINYLEMFDYYSDKYFDFFIPGYTTEEWESDSERCFVLRSKKYYFSRQMFYDFINNLNNEFNIEYTYNPMLILASMKPAQKHTAEFIILELDGIDPHGVKRSGKLFEKIFDAAKKDPSVKSMSNTLMRTLIKGDILVSVIHAIGNSMLSELHSSTKRIRRFKIRSIPH